MYQCLLSAVDNFSYHPIMQTDNNPKTHPLLMTNGMDRKHIILVMPYSNPSADKADFVTKLMASLKKVNKKIFGYFKYPF